MFSGKMRKNKTHRYFFSCLSAGDSLQCRWQDAQLPPQPPCQPPFWQMNPMASASSTKITITTITLAISKSPPTITIPRKLAAGKCIFCVRRRILPVAERRRQYMENIGVTCDVCSCAHHEGGSKCSLEQIHVTEHCEHCSQTQPNPHFCNSYEEK